MIEMKRITIRETYEQTEICTYEVPESVLNEYAKKIDVSIEELLEYNLHINDDEIENYRVNREFETSLDIIEINVKAEDIS
jgi:hypothetical protein